MTQPKPVLSLDVSHGLAWSGLSNIVLRLGSLAVSIVLARLLSPEQFGVFAVALTVQTVLMTMADLGMSADLIRSDKPQQKAPTVATLGLAAGALLTTTMAFSAQGTAELLGSAAAGPVIAVMSGSLFLAGAGVVPYASLQRNFAQKKLFVVALVDFTLGTALVLLLITFGWGVMALAVGRLVSQAVALGVQFRLSGEPLRYGFDKALAPSILAFGAPVAGANLLSWALLNVDNIVISRLAGPVALGFYFLAFNISSWPMSALGQVVRSIALPAFSRISRGSNDLTFARFLGPVWAVALWAGVMLAVLAKGLIELVYGPVWLPAAEVLGWLGIFSTLRIVFDLAASYLLARGAARSTLYVQGVWIAALIPALILGVAVGGIPGGAAAHLIVSVVVVAPAYAIALKHSGADLRATLGRLRPPVLAALPAAGTSVAVSVLVTDPPVNFVAAGLAGTAVYGLLLRRWFMRSLSGIRAMLDDGERPSHAEGVAAKERVRSQNVMSDDATVTVVVTCYNYARFIRQAVESAIFQRGVRVDVVIVDDASTDDSLRVAEELVTKYQAVSVLRHPENLGPVASFNDGARAAQGEFVVRLDADDLLTPGSLARSVQLARAYPSVGLVYGHPIHFAGEELPRPRQKALSWTIWPGRQWLEERCSSGVNVITSPEALTRRSVLEAIGYQAPLKHTHDMELWLRIAAFYDVGYVHGADQAWHREHPESLSARCVDDLEDLRARRDAFDVLFRGPASRIPDANKLLGSAHRSLANDALSRATHEFDLGRGPNDGTNALVALAGELAGDVTALSTWNRYALRVNLVGSAFSRLLLSRSARAAGSIRNRARMRRWHSHGVF